ncbi:MAG: hypothetical protein GX573_05985 [Chloroflexi bacterium]|nr:hypothetical protein [Chloroflexota bacterium]
MTPTITQKIIGTISETDYELLSSTVGVVMIVLLLSLLILKEMVRAADAPAQDHAWNKALTAVTLPLMGAFAVVVIMRIITFLAD